MPEGVKVEITNDNTTKVTGLKGALVRQFPSLIKVEIDGIEIKVSRISG